MSASLSRRIRRIGLLPTTFKTVKETRLERNEEGAEVEVVHNKKVPLRQCARLSHDDRKQQEDRLRAEAKKRRAEWKAARKKAARKKAA